MFLHHLCNANFAMLQFNDERRANATRCLQSNECRKNGESICKGGVNINASANVVWLKYKECYECNNQLGCE